MKLEWSTEALADLDRFAAYLNEHYPTLAGQVAEAIVAKSRLIEEHPLIGRPVQGGSEYREVIVRVLNARYIMQYRVEADRMVVLRVTHGRELR